MVCSLVSIYFGNPQLAYNESKLHKTLDYGSKDMLNFNFSEKGLGLFFAPHFLHDFSRKMFLMLYLLTDQISLSDCLITSRDTGQYVHYNYLLTGL